MRRGPLRIAWLLLALWPLAALAADTLATVRERLREHRAHIESLVVPSTHEEST